MIFVDTSAWFAAAVANDPDHASAAAFLQQTAAPRLVTTDFVLDEALTLFRVRGADSFGVILGRKILDGIACKLEYVTPDDLANAFQTFASYRDKGWSFTDCTSLVVMNRLGVSQALAFDRHFSQFGSIQVLPDRR